MCSSKTIFGCFGESNLQGKNDYRIVDYSQLLSLSLSVYFSCVWGRWPHLTDGDVSQTPFLCYADLRGRAFGPRMSNTVYFSSICDLMLNSPPAFPLLLRAGNARDYLRPLNGNSHFEKTQVTPDCSSATNGTAEPVSSWGEHLSADYNRSTLMLMRLRRRSGFMCSIRM